MADSSTVLQYQLSPLSVQANTRSNFALTITNGGDRLQLTRDDEIYLALPVGDGATDLTPNLSDIDPQAPQNWRFSKFPGGGEYNFIISPLDEVTLEAQATLPFSLNTVIINAQQGNCTVKLQEFIGAGGKKDFSIEKSEAKLSIIAQAIPSTVGKTQRTKLRWTAAKAGYVTISPLNVRVGTEGELETTPYLDVTPPMAQVSYTFTAWTQDQKFATDIVVVTISPPIIRKFEPQDLPPIDFDDFVRLDWAVDYAETVMLTLPGGAAPQKAVDSLEVQPKKMLSGNASMATYTLRATGTGNPVLAQVNIHFKPVSIDFFRYPDFESTSSFQFHVRNGTGTVVQEAGAQGPYFKLTANGPYGPLVQYLGNYPQVQVQVFLASPQGSAPGASVNLQWQTYLAASLTLRFDGVDHVIDKDQIARGRFLVEPVASTQYLLIASDAQGKSVTSSLMVQVG